jgi:hypothetical protein
VGDAGDGVGVRVVGERVVGERVGTRVVGERVVGAAVGARVVVGAEVGQSELRLVAKTPPVESASIESYQMGRSAGFSDQPYQPHRLGFAYTRRSVRICIEASACGREPASLFS